MQRRSRPTFISLVIAVAALVVLVWTSRTTHRAVDSVPGLRDPSSHSVSGEPAGVARVEERAERQTLDEAQPTPVDRDLDAAEALGTWVLEVVTDSGAPLAGVRLDVSGVDGATVRTGESDADGLCVVARPRLGTAQVHATPPSPFGCVTTWANLDLSEPTSRTRVVIALGRSVAGTVTVAPSAVVDAEAIRVALVPSWLVARPSAFAAAVRGGHHGVRVQRVGDGGEFTFEGVSPNASLGLIAYAEGHAARWQPVGESAQYELQLQPVFVAGVWLRSEDPRTSRELRDAPLTLEYTLDEGVHCEPVDSCLALVAGAAADTFDPPDGVRYAWTFVGDHPSPGHGLDVSLQWQDGRRIAVRAPLTQASGSLACAVVWVGAQASGDTATREVRLVPSGRARAIEVGTSTPPAELIVRDEGGVVRRAFLRRLDAPLRLAGLPTTALTLEVVGLLDSRLHLNGVESIVLEPGSGPDLIDLDSGCVGTIEVELPPALAGYNGLVTVQCAVASGSSTTSDMVTFGRPPYALQALAPGSYDLIVQLGHGTPRFTELRGAVRVVAAEVAVVRF